MLPEAICCLPMSNQHLSMSCSRELGPLPPPVSEAEFEEIMNRNRAISSSAISKAVSGASAGKLQPIAAAFLSPSPVASLA